MTTEEDAIGEIRRMFTEARLRASLWDISECPPTSHLTPLTIENGDFQ